MPALKQAAINFFFSYNPDERDRGDDLGIIAYSLFWMYFVTILVLTQDLAVALAQQFYIWFDLLCIIFLVLHLWKKKSRHVPGKTDFSLPTKIMWIKVIPLVCILLLVLYISSVFIFAMFPQMSTTNASTSTTSLDFQYLLYGYLRIVPTEELAFRGLGIELFLLLEPVQLVTTSFHNSAIEQIKQNKYFITGAISSSFLFGLLHFRAYPDVIGPLIYLIILGFMLAFLRFKYGLFAAMMLHALNNLFASGLLIAMIAMLFIH